MLGTSDIDRFIVDGFVRIERAFPRALAESCREILWRDTGCNPDDPATWTKPVIRLDQYTQAPFRQAANTERLRSAFDQLVGAHRWAPRGSLGTFPIRFPSTEDPGDAGWHVDAGYWAEDGSMRVNLASRGRALLMLFLFSDVGPDDAPTRIWAGSHLIVPPLLEPAGEQGLSFIELALELPPVPDDAIAFAQGEAGDVYLCHPFLVHAAQPHRGTRPRFLAQPPLAPTEPLRIDREDGHYSPVERAIRIGLGREPRLPA